jgi:MoxR-like ATPase
MIEAATPMPMPMSDAVSVAPMLAGWRAAALELETRVGSVVIGQTRAIRLMTIAIFARGHVLLAGDVGVGKTTLLRAVARAIGGAYERVEGTVDMMPGDLLYHTYLADDGRTIFPSSSSTRSTERVRRCIRFFSG